MTTVISEEELERQKVFYRNAGKIMSAFDESCALLSDGVEGGSSAVELLREGVEIWLYRHAMVHSKTMTVDGHWSTIGTANIDRLSMRGNYEVCLQFFSRPLAARMEEIFANDLTTARRLTIDEWEKRSTLTRIGEVLLGPLEPLV